jgi:hypothetical protein
MQLDAKLELAHAIIDTFRVREESFIPAERRYAKSYWETAIETVADPDLRDLVPNMLAWSREHVEWAETFLERHKTE